MTYSKIHYFGGCATIQVSPTSQSVTYTQKFPEVRLIVFNGGQTSGAGQTYTFRFEWPITDLNYRGDVGYVFINDTDFSTINLQLTNLLGTAATSMDPKSLRRTYIRAGGIWVMDSGTIKSTYDDTVTPAQFIVFGQSASPFNGTYMYNPIADSWTTKINRPASGSTCSGVEITSSNVDNAMFPPYLTYHGDGTSFYQYNNNDSYTIKTSSPQSTSNRAIIGSYESGNRYLYAQGASSGGAMSLFRYNTSANSWATSNSASGFDQSFAQAAQINHIALEKFIMFGVGSSPVSIRVASLVLGNISWEVLFNPPTGGDFVGAAISATGEDDHEVHVFGGNTKPNDYDEYGVRHHRIYRRAANESFWRTGQMLNYGPMGQACFVHSQKEKLFYLMAGYQNGAGGAYQTHTSYNDTTESYATVTPRSWSTAGGAARHNARARINWMV